MNMFKLINFIYTITDGKTGKALSVQSIVAPWLERETAEGSSRTIRVDHELGWFELEQYSAAAASNMPGAVHSVALFHAGVNRDGFVAKHTTKTTWNGRQERLTASLETIHTATKDEDARGLFNLGGLKDNEGPLFSRDDLAAASFMALLGLALKQRPEQTYVHASLV